MVIIHEGVTLGKAGAAFLAALEMSPPPGIFLPRSSAALWACTAPESCEPSSHNLAFHCWQIFFKILRHAVSIIAH